MNDNLNVELLREYVESYPVFLETSIGNGDSLKTALDLGFDTVYGIADSWKEYEESQQRFIQSSRVNLMKGGIQNVFEVMASLIMIPMIVSFDEKPSEESISSLGRSGFHGTFSEDGLILLLKKDV